MIKIGDVLEQLIPNGGYVVRGEAFEDIEFIDCEPITKAEYEAGVIAHLDWKAAKEEEANLAKEAAQAKLAELGLTTDDLKALGL